MATPSPATNGGDAAPKAFGGILAIVALIAGVYAMVEPMQQRIDSLAEQNKELSDEIHERTKAIDGRIESGNQSQASTSAAISALDQRFNEVETRITGMHSLHDTQIDDCVKHIDQLEHLRGEASQHHEYQERLRAIEREVFGITILTTPPRYWTEPPAGSN